MRQLLCLLVAVVGCGTPAAPKPPSSELTADYVIVGAGTAGSVLAYRLSESGASVLVLEAGPPDDDPRIHDPASWMEMLAKPETHWQYSTVPQPGFGNRPIEIWQGKLWGGSSSHNAMFWVRGHPADYDGWHARNWTWKDVEPYLVRAEQAIRPDLHPTNDADQMDVAAMREVLGSREVAGDAAIGGSPGAWSNRDNRRRSTADAYLRPALQRPNVRVESLAVVSRVVFEDKRAIGVEWIRDGKTHRARANREVILSAGAFGSPAILLRSGVGPAAEIAKLGVPLVADLPVGKNLQDHVQVGTSWKALRPLSRNGRCKAICFGAVGYASTVGAKQPDLQFLFEWQPEADATDEPWVGNDVVLLHPKSHGELTLTSTDPNAMPVIDPNYLADPSDLDTLVAGIQIARKIAAASAAKEWFGAEINPGPAVTSDEALRTKIRKEAWTIWHPVGTCRMGDGPDAVVDFELRVRGLDHLRVADASIMPTLTSGNTQAPSMMIGERAADLIIPPGSGP